MEAFLGSWKLVSSINFDKYMEELDIPAEIRNFGNNMTSVVTFSQDGDNVVMKIRMFGNSNQTHTLSFKLGEEFDDVTMDFRSCRSVFNLEEGKLVQVQKWEGKKTTLSAEIQDGNIIMTFVFRGVVCVRTYERN